jgi:hypothetical protein
MKTYKVVMLFIVAIFCLTSLVYARRGPCEKVSGYTHSTLKCESFSCTGVKVIYFDVGDCNDVNENDCPESTGLWWISYPPATSTCLLWCDPSSVGTTATGPTCPY